MYWNIEKEPNLLLEVDRLIRTEVVLKCIEGDFIIYLSSCLIRTEVVLKFSFKSKYNRSFWV